MNGMRHLTRHHLPAFVIVCLFVALGTLYSVVDPLFESSDEINHYPYVAHLARGLGFPRQEPGENTLWAQEGGQPPLYYLMAAGLTFWIPTGDLPELVYLNPHARRGLPLATDNKNMVIHSTAEDLPWQGSALAVHLIRLFSVLLGAGTVVCTYAIARAIFPQRPILALGAMAFNAFLPMFLFISASVNNDNLVVLLSSLALYLMVRLLQRGTSRRGLLLLGLVIGLAGLSKLSGMALAPLAALVLAWRRFQVEVASTGGGRRSRLETAAGRWLIDCTIVAIPVVLVAGWWYLRNWQLYGDPTGLNVFLDIAGRREVTPTLAVLLGEFQGFRINFWGLFGAVNILMRPVAVYTLLDFFSVLALLGLVWWVWRTRRSDERTAWPALSLLALWIVVVMVALIRWTMATLASQGRLLFPAISAVAILFVLGLTAWLPPRRQGLMAGGFAGLLFVLALSAPFSAILPAYPRPPILTPADVPPTATPVNYDYGGVMRLLAFEVDRDVIRPGGEIAVTLYWQQLKATAADYSIYLQVFGWHQNFGQRDTYPGSGAYPTSRLRAGQVLADRLVVPISPDARGPTPAWISAGLYRLATQDKLDVVDAAGHEVIFPVLSRLRLEVAPPTLLPQQPLDIDFQGRVRLIGFDLEPRPVPAGEPAPITLYWQVEGKLDRDYTVFVHLVDARGEIVAQGDAPPLTGFYPTEDWSAGEILNDDHLIDIKSNVAPGRYQVLAGFYDANGSRLPVVNAAGQVIGDYAVVTVLDVVSR